MKIQYTKVARCNNTPVVDYYFRAMIELTDKGHNHQSVSFSYDQQAIVAEHKGRIVGVLLYDIQEWGNSLLVVLGYVSKGYRKQGIYSELWKRAVAIAKAAGLGKIQGGTHHTNKAMQKVMAKQGRVKTMVLYEYAVPKKGKGESHGKK